MDEFMLEAHYRNEERDRDSLSYYGDSESNMIDEMIRDSNEDVSGELDSNDLYNEEFYDEYFSCVPKRD